MRKILVGLVIIGLVGGFLNFNINANQNDDWPMFGHDPQHTGYSNCKMPEELELLWEYKTAGRVSSSPAVVEGKVFVGSGDSYLYCLDANTGELIWRYGR